MYFELEAKTEAALHGAVWEASMMGLDPEMNSEPLTFNIGTGSIEKVSNLRDKYGLTEVYVSEFEPYHPYGE
jgi:hypothetical protein